MNNAMGESTLQEQATEMQWAQGCKECTFGIVSAQELTGAASLYLERMVQMIDGDIQFCLCKAGTRYRSALMNRRQALIEEARADVRMDEQDSHPDIEKTRQAMTLHYGKMYSEAPTIHFDA